MRRTVNAPGSRGGRVRFTSEGAVRYDAAPTPRHSIVQTTDDHFEPATWTPTFGAQAGKPQPLSRKPRAGEFFALPNGGVGLARTDDPIPGMVLPILQPRAYVVEQFEETGTVPAPTEAQDMMQALRDKLREKGALKAFLGFLKADVRKPVQKPGSRGGRFYFTRRNAVRYGRKAAGHAQHLQAHYGADLTLRKHGDGVAVVRQTPDGGMVIARGADPAAAVQEAEHRLRALPEGAVDLREVPRPRRDRITLGELQAATERARRQWPEDSNAARMEILLHPHVYRTFRKLNPNLDVKRGYNAAYGPGHVTELVHQGGADGEVRAPWNSVREDYFGHAPGSAYSGVYREAKVMSFLDDLVAAANGYLPITTLGESESYRKAARAGLRVVGSTRLPDGVRPGDRFERASGEVVSVERAEDDELVVRNHRTRKRERLGVGAITEGRVTPLERPRTVTATPPAVQAREVAQRLWGTDFDVRTAGDRTQIVRATDAGPAIVGEGPTPQAALEDAHARLTGAHQLLALAKADNPQDPQRQRNGSGGSKPPRLTFAPPKDPDGQHELGKTKSGKMVYASGADCDGFDDQDHHDAASYHHEIFAHHDTRAAKHREHAGDDRDWRRSESHHEDAERHAKLADHHHDIVRDHLIAGGHGGNIALDAQGDPKLGDELLPHSDDDRAEARARLKKRRHWGHPGGLTDRDRSAYAEIRERVSRAPGRGTPDTASRRPGVANSHDDAPARE